MLGECRRIYTNAGNTAARLQKFNGLEAEPLYHPPHLADRLTPGPYGDYVLGVGRLETVKRRDLAIEAMQLRRPAECGLLLAGEGTQRANLEALAGQLGVADRVRFLDAVPDETLIELYAGALAVVYAAVRRGLRLRDARGVSGAQARHHGHRLGRPARVRRRRRQRRDCVADAEAMADAINRYAADRSRPRRTATPADARASLVTLGRRDREAGSE